MTRRRCHLLRCIHPASAIPEHYELWSPMTWVPVMMTVLFRPPACLRTAPSIHHLPRCLNRKICRPSRLLVIGSALHISPTLRRRGVPTPLRVPAASALASIPIVIFRVCSSMKVYRDLGRNRWALRFEPACPTPLVMGHQITRHRWCKTLPPFLRQLTEHEATLSAPQAMLGLPPALVRSLLRWHALLTTTDMTPMGFQSAAMARPRTNTVTTFPPGLDLHNQYRPMVFNTMQHHIQAHVSPGFQSAPLSVPYDFCYDAAIQNCYTHGYGSTTPATSTISHEAESYYHSEPYPRRIEESLHEGFVASPMADPVMTTTSSSVAIGQSAVDEYLRDGINLQPDYQQTRRRSFTLPNDFQRTN